MLIDDNGITCFTDDLGATCWVDDNSELLCCQAGIAVTVGTFTLTGNDANLIYTPLGTTAYSLSVDIGAFIVNGYDARLPGDTRSGSTSGSGGWGAGVKGRRRGHSGQPTPLSKAHRKLSELDEPPKVEPLFSVEKVLAAPPARVLEDPVAIQARTAAIRGVIAADNAAVELQARHRLEQALRARAKALEDEQDDEDILLLME